MDIPSPAFSFAIPSIHDGCQLQCRLYLPHWLQDIQSTPTIRGAIIAHPYAPLGGCYDDPVVGFIGCELLRAGYIVGTFNFRGAGNSEGRTSWTARPELGDYASFYGFMMQHLQHVQVATQRWHGNPPSARADQRIHLVLGGYSYGSLIASHVPTLDVMLDLFCGERSAPNTPIHEIGKAAGNIAARSLPEPCVASTGDTDEPGLHASISISYLLVSPLLPPVSQALTVFSSLSVRVAGVSAQARPVQPSEQLSTHRTLALYGDQDTFTSARKLQTWSAELARVNQSQFRGCVIEGAGHFWREAGVEARARQVLQEWLCQT
ncbi:hypothetical protein N7492_009465 [Penicillium capsulatum]|uniref:AB hydrolase-1 domain-containing protein n=1 Tax=Penicillium capsulatum TaxID=69766 RepID=A0A9W9HSV3_9EURO|nr:hypothetical protein N7492_009465 [Penicillium capsulatum]KAJ6106855.1 hypothetical protein N7512_010372 [Penicillium capsulatum]